jgi:HNH endonuclease
MSVAHRKVLPPEQRQIVIDTYATGNSTTAIAARLGCTVALVTRTLEVAGVARRPKGFRHGEKHHAWVGGRHVRDGYVRVWLSADDPLVSMAQRHGTSGGGYVFEHRLVMAKHLGRPLLKSETVHHKNNDTQNNDISNLQLRQGRHGKGAAFKCADCGSCNIVSAPLADGVSN